MRGVFTFDLLTGLLILFLLSGSLFTPYTKFKDAFVSASCHYLKDLYNAELNEASSIGFDVVSSFSSGEISIVNGEIYVLGVKCP